MRTRYSPPAVTFFNNKSANKDRTDPEVIDKIVRWHRAGVSVRDIAMRLKWNSQSQDCVVEILMEEGLPVFRDEPHKCPRHGNVLTTPCVACTTIRLTIEKKNNFK